MEKRAWRAVLFDFDGVICQTEVYRIDRREAMLTRYGVRFDRKALYAMAGGPSTPGIPYSRRMDELFGDQPAYREHREELSVFLRLDCSYRDLLTPGLPQVLEDLHRAGLLLGVASNSSLETLEAALAECAVRDCFDTVVSGWNLNRRKPDPYIYELAMKDLGVEPGECVIVEDSPVGIRAGKAAGTTVFALRDRDGMLDQGESDFIMSEITELPGLLGLIDHKHLG